MTLRRFLPYSAAAALAWAALFTLLGYAFSSSVTTVGDTVTWISIAAIAVAGLALWIRRVRLSRTRRDSIVSARRARRSARAT